MLLYEREKEKKRGVCVWVGSLEKKKNRGKPRKYCTSNKASRKHSISFLIFFIRRLMWVQNILSDFFSLLSTFIYFFYFGHAWVEKAFHLFLLIFLFHYHFFIYLSFYHIINYIIFIFFFLFFSISLGVK